MTQISFVKSVLRLTGDKDMTIWELIEELISFLVLFFTLSMNFPSLLCEEMVYPSVGYIFIIGMVIGKQAYR